MGRAMKLLFCYLENRIAEKAKQRHLCAQVEALKHRLAALEKAIEGTTWMSAHASFKKQFDRARAN